MGQRTYSDTTLKSLTKDELIGLIRVLEHNVKANEEALNNQSKLLNICDEMIERQAKMFESKPATAHGYWDDTFDDITPFCSVCGKSHHDVIRTPKYCSHCGAKMDDEMGTALLPAIKNGTIN